MKTLYFECNMGAAGDMLMSSLFELCEKKELFLTTMNQLFSPEVKLTPRYHGNTDAGVNPWRRRRGL